MEEQEVFAAEQTETEEPLDFSGFAEEDTKPAGEPEKETGDATAAEAEAQSPAEEAFSLPVKYNGQEQTLSREQAIEYAQKGMNYDHVAGELKQLREAPEFTLIDQLARSAGMTRREYVEQLKGELERQEVEKYIRQGIPEDYAKQLLENRRRADETQAQMEDMKKELEDMKAREASAMRWGAFLQKHPDVSGFDALPDEVKARVSGGEDPETAYTAYENKILKEKLQAMEQREKNAQAAPGSVSGDGQGEEMDSFQRAMMEALRG